jgi:hypothetical protein
MNEYQDMDALRAVDSSVMFVGRKRYGAEDIF